MSNEAIPSRPAGVQVEHLRLVADRPWSTSQAQALGQAFATELDEALRAAVRQPMHLRIRELVVDAGGASLQDRGALRQLARTAAQRILDRTPE